MMRKKSLFVLSAALLAGSLFSACSSGSMDSTPYRQHEAGLTLSSNCNDYKSHFLDIAAMHIARNYYYYGNPYEWLLNGGVDLDMAVPIGVEMEDAVNYAPSAEPNNAGGKGSSASPSAAEFTTTNVQETGVDELDTIKNDGSTMYTLDHKGIHVIKSWPADELTEIAFIPYRQEEQKNCWWAGGEYGRGLFLENNKLVVVKSDDRYEVRKELENSKQLYEPDNLCDGYSWNIMQWVNGTVVDVYDVSNPASPKLERSFDFPTSFETARMVNGKIYLVMNYQRSLSFMYNNLYDVEIPGIPERGTYYDSYEELQVAINNAVPKIREYLDEYTKDWNTEDFLPNLKITDAEGNISDKQLVSCNQIYLPSTSSNEMGLMNVVELDVNDLKQYHSTAIADYGWMVYASTDNLYITSNSGYWYWDCWNGDDCGSYSHIHKFDFDGKNGHIDYVASGEIKGYVNDPYWMSEYDEHLRVASTENSWGNSSEGSMMTVLKQNGKKLEETGHIDGIAPGERIYAARMFGPKGYMVTFEQTDPLFTIDLSNPSDPKIMGELNINGYSSYIHPMDETHLLTIGEDATEEGSTIGLHLQIFDVSDMKKPVRTHHELISQNMNSYSYSDALWDPHAFTYHAPSGLLAVPINIEKWSEWGYSNFSGMLVYKASPEDGFHYIGAVNHNALRKEIPEYYWWTNMTRSRFMFEKAGEYDKGAYVYALSDLGLTASDAYTPKDILSYVTFDTSY